MDVASDLQVAELHWAAAQGVDVVRYATGSDNEGSHRLGARDGFELIAEFQLAGAQRRSATPSPTRTSAYDAGRPRGDDRKRRALLAGLSAQGVIAATHDARDALAARVARSDLQRRRAPVRTAAVGDPGADRGGLRRPSRARRGRRQRHARRGRRPIGRSASSRRAAAGRGLGASTVDADRRPAAGGRAARARPRACRRVTRGPRSKSVARCSTTRPRSSRAAGYRSPNWALHLLAGRSMPSIRRPSRPGASRPGRSARRLTRHRDKVRAMPAPALPKAIRDEVARLGSADIMVGIPSLQERGDDRLRRARRAGRPGPVLPRPAAGRSSTPTPARPTARSASWSRPSRPTTSSASCSSGRATSCSASA